MQQNLWRQPEFLKLWLATSISSLGSQVTVLAMPLAAVLLFNAGTAETGALAALSVAPTAIFGLPAGAWVDRLPRRRIRIIGDLLSAAIIASVPIASVLNRLTLQHLYIATFLAGAAAVWTRTSISAILPSLVGRQNLIEANTRIMLSMSVALIAGPSLGGLLVQLLSAPIALAADTASFLASAFAVSRVHLEETPPLTTRRKSLYYEVRDGLTWLRGEPVLLRLTVCIGVANMSLYGVQAVIVVYATRDLSLEPAQLGLALGAMGPATLIGALVAGNVARRFGLGPTLIAALTGETISRFLILAAGGPPVIAMLWLGAAQLTFGFIAPLWDVNANSLRQSTPQHLLGRISAASAAVGVGLAPVGALLAGWIGDMAGPRAAILESALVTLVGLAILVRSPVPGLRDASGYLAQRAAKAGKILS